MPELPEVETIKRGLEKKVIGKKITGATVNLPKIINRSPAEFTRLLKNTIIKKVARRAKILMLTLSNGHTLGIHLKISGRLLYLKKNSPVEKHTHVIFDLNNGHQIRFWDLRRFGYVKLMRSEEAVKELKLDEFGPEPLTKEFTLDIFKNLLNQRKNSRIKPLLMDQGFVAGIGNIYADEILFYARVHPLRPAGELSARETKDIFNGTKKILTTAVQKKGTTVDLYVDLSGRAGNYVNYLKAYGCEDKPCVRCGARIQRIKIGSRSAHFCPRCQKQ